MYRKSCYYYFSFVCKIPRSLDVKKEFCIIGEIRFFLSIPFFISLLKCNDDLVPLVYSMPSTSRSLLHYNNLPCLEHFQVFIFSCSKIVRLHFLNAHWEHFVPSCLYLFLHLRICLEIGHACQGYQDFLQIYLWASGPRLFGVLLGASKKLL